MKPALSTNIEQSRRLLACGVDPKTADMVWLDDGNNRSRLTIYTPIISSRYKVVEAWSLSALSEIAKSLIPKDVIIGIDCKDNEWIACVEWFEYEAHIRKHFKAGHLIDIFLNMIEWLTANASSLNKIEE